MPTIFKKNGFLYKQIKRISYFREGKIRLMPAFGAIESMLFLGERLYWFHWLGIALIALGIYLATALRVRTASASR